MKFIQKTNRLIKASLSVLLLGLSACSYLDVIPPAQPDYDDTMKDEATTLGFLFTAYSYIPGWNPFIYQHIENSTDEMVHPKDWGVEAQQMLFGTISPSSDPAKWETIYNYIGYVHYFMEQLELLHPVGVTEDDKKQLRAEAYFLEAYYHFRALEAFGPCPIIPKKMDQNISKNDIPGRSHFDYCVDFIVDKLDSAAFVLPPKRETADLGRADATICKCLKARVLLYAASPLWNGSFYDKNWRNKNFETPEYGTELVSTTYDRKKWERARTACQEALKAAEDAGYELFNIETANQIADRMKVPLPFIPGLEEDTEENREFKERVRMFQYLSTATEGDNNKEIIWGQMVSSSNLGEVNPNISRLPERSIKKSDGSWAGGYAGWAPTLNAVQRFYTVNGETPKNDKAFYPESQWYERYYEGTSSPDLETNGLDKENVKNDIIKFNVHREARYYAWIAFDGGQYSPILLNNEPLWLNLKNSNTNGYRAGLRNAAGTGFLTKKFITPDLVYNTSGGLSGSRIRAPFIRLAELHLNLAECYAALDQPDEALIQLNIIRKRAGIKELETKDLSTMSLTEWIRNERFVELYQEGHRYYDIRRWGIAPDVQKAGGLYGLNGMTINPSFEDFNKPTLINQPIKWDNRQYLAPILNSEIYSNPQLVQAPGY